MHVTQQEAVVGARILPPPRLEYAGGKSVVSVPYIHIGLQRQ